jgi:hypothetical protein
MRIGQNPARRSIPAYSPHRLGVASLVYIPMLDGYFEQMLPVVEIHLRSLRQNTAEPFDLLVFDNASCDEVKDVLLGWQKEGLIDWLISSRYNLGKTGALNWIIGAMPNELITYSDSDVLFRPGWLESSLQILTAFPQAGMITAQPDFYPLVEGKMKAHLQVDSQQVETRERMPSAQAVDEYVQGLGNQPKTRERVDGKLVQVLVNKSSGAQAVIGATHMQFLARRSVLQQALPLPATLGLSPEEDQALDARVDERGYLHLSTLEPYVYHMGNQVDEITRQAGIMKRQNSHSQPDKQGLPDSRWDVRLLTWLARAPIFKGLFLRLYNRLFQIYSQSPR